MSKYLAESNHVVTLHSMETEECSVHASLNDNFQERDKTIPEWDKETQVIHPKYHQSGRPVLKIQDVQYVWKKQAVRSITVARRVRRSPGIMHCDLAALEASADGHKYCLVAAVTIEVNKESKLLPFFADAQEGMQYVR